MANVSPASSTTSWRSRKPASRSAVRPALHILALALALLGAAPAAHAAEPVDLLLVLAVDSSGSVDPEEFVLQRRGYAAALTDPEVIKSITSGPHGGIAITLFEWSGPLIQGDLIGWTRIDGPGSAQSAAAKLLDAPRTIFGGGTSISGALDHGRELMRASPFTAQRRVIDVSGDGRNNRGRPLAQARAQALSEGIIINGLPILGSEFGLDRYYEDEVIGGPGAFIVVANGFEDFARAIVRKLLRDLVSEAR